MSLNVKAHLKTSAVMSALIVVLALLTVYPIITAKVVIGFLFCVLMALFYFFDLPLILRKY